MAECPEVSLSLATSIQILEELANRHDCVVIITSGSDANTDDLDVKWCGHPSLVVGATLLAKTMVVREATKLMNPTVIPEEEGEEDEDTDG
jgi:hypothetical protein